MVWDWREWTPHNYVRQSDATLWWAILGSNMCHRPHEMTVSPTKTPGFTRHPVSEVDTNVCCICTGRANSGDGVAVMAKAKSSGRMKRGSGAVRWLPSGKWQAKVRVDGAYYAAPDTFDTKQAATIWLKRQHDEIDAGTWSPPTKKKQPTTFGVFAEQWLAGRNLKPRTVEQYRTILDNHLLPAWGKRGLRSITVGQVDGWYRALDLPPTSKAHTYGLLRTILNGAWRLDLIDANPCRIEGAGQVKRASRTTVPTAVQVQALADGMPSAKYRVMVLVAAWCGLRFGELTELRPIDIEVDDDGIPVVIRVRRAVTRVGGKCVVGTPKSDAGIRDVVIPPHIRGDLAEYVQNGRGGPQGLLFPASRTGAHIAPSALYKPFYRVRDELGLPELRWHDLRHFHGTTVAQAGATLAEVQARLGHSTSSAAMRYQHAAAGRDAVLAEQLSDNVVPMRRKKA